MNLEQKITSYQPTQAVIDLVKSVDILLIAGIVCAGKDTIVRELLKDDQFLRIVSHTSRAPRANHGILEQDGIEYHFMSLAEAESMVDNHEFIETKYVHGNVYGTSADELRSIKEAGKIALADVDVQGVSEYLTIKPDTKALFLLPPSVETWLSRLERRYGVLDMNSEELKKRFRTAISEIEHIKADGRFIMIINDDLVTTAERISKVLHHERDQTSEFAESITEHLLEYLRSHV